MGTRGTFEHHRYSLLVSLLAIGWGSINAQNNDLQYHYQQGVKACTESRFDDCLQHFQTANQLRPNHQIIMYHLARAYSFNENIDSSAHYLRSSLAIKADWDLADSAFNNWNSSDRFQALVAFQQNQMAAVKLSEPVVRLTDRTLHIESIAYDPKSNHLFLGSVHQQKILRVDLNDQSVTDFKDTAAHGLWSIFGMKVDTLNRYLWVCSTATDLMVQADSSLEGSAMVYQFDVDSGDVIATFTLNDTTNHWFGDLTLSPEGMVYVSDSGTNTIYLIDPEDQQMVPFFHNEDFLSIQGLDLSKDGKYLMVADYVKGLYRLDLSDKQLIKLNNQLDGVSLKSIDGLYFFENSLITTQNQVVPMRVTQYFLNEQADAVVDLKYLEKGNPLLNEPTLGVLVGDWFYYVANSQWGGYDEQKNPKPHEELQDIYIMRVPLRGN